MTTKFLPNWRQGRRENLFNNSVKKIRHALSDVEIIKLIHQDIDYLVEGGEWVHDVTDPCKICGVPTTNYARCNSCREAGEFDTSPKPWYSNKKE